jgi:sugar/nucleoside kinase (ribokinase family)
VGTVVLTLGKEGAHARAENLHVSASPPSTAVLDTLGAGDAFRAGFLAGFLRQGEDPAVALQWGLTNAASVVGSHTTQKGLLAQSVLEERLRKHPIAVDRSMVEA